MWLAFSLCFLRHQIDVQTAVPELADLRGQLLILSQTSQQQQQAQVEQMSALSKRLEDSLAGMSQRMSQSLQQQTEKTHQNLADLSARLAVIDAANAKISELTGQVTQLHNILANKTDRGAFGEVQLENLVQTVLPPNAYDFQVSCLMGSGQIVLKLPSQDIVIDSKFPLEYGISCSRQMMRLRGGCPQTAGCRL